MRFGMKLEKAVDGATKLVLGSLLKWPTQGPTLKWLPERDFRNVQVAGLGPKSVSPKMTNVALVTATPMNAYSGIVALSPISWPSI